MTNPMTIKELVGGYKVQIQEVNRGYTTYHMVAPNGVIFGHVRDLATATRVAREYAARAAKA